MINTDKYSVCVTKRNENWIDVLYFKNRNNAEKFYNFVVNEIATDKTENIKEVSLRNGLNRNIESMYF